MIFLSACSRKVELSEEKADEKVDRLEVVYFHATQRCFSCIELDRLTKDTIYEFFQAELRDGRIEFKEINVDLRENKELVTKFRARGSSLYINKIYENKNVIEEDVMVWRLLNDEVRFKNYLRNKFNQFLGE